VNPGHWVIGKKILVNDNESTSVDGETTGLPQIQACSSRLDDKAFTRGRIDHFAIKNANEQPNVTPSTTEKWNIFQRVTYDNDL